MSAPREGVVVLGVPRSGTTLVRRLLDAHPEIACPPETGVLSAAARFMAEQAFPSGVRFGPGPGLAQIGVARAELLDRLRELAVGFLRDHARRAGKRIWAEKSVSDVFFVPAIEEILGDTVTWVVVVRHGLDVAVSLKDLVERAGAFTAELFPYAQRDPNVVAAMARAWCDATTACLDLAARRPDGAVVVRYEDLVGDPGAVLERVFAAIGVPPVPPALPPEQQVGFGDWKTWSRGGIDATAVGRYRKQIPRPLLAALLPEVNPVLERAGYPPVPVPRAVDPMAAQRRLEVALRLEADREKADVDAGSD